LFTVNERLRANKCGPGTEIAHTNTEPGPRFIEIRRAIEHAAAIQRKKYQLIDGFSIRFELDDSKAEKDATTFQQMCIMLGARKVESLVIPADDRHPGWTVADFCDQHIIKSRPHGRNLVLLHYAGHGGLNPMAKTLFCYAGPGSKQSFRWDTIMNRVVTADLVKKLSSADSRKMAISFTQQMSGTL
jgi:hypothetical protein